MQITIVGAGVIGLFSAWHLRRAGHEVSIVDRGDMTDNCSFGNAGMLTPSHFVPLAAPGVVAQGLRWMFRSDSPFYIRPRLDIELLAWLWRFYRSCNAKKAEAAMPVLLDFNLEGKQGYEDLAREAGLDFHLRKEGILMLYHDPHVEREELETAEKAWVLGLEPRVLTPPELAEFEPCAATDLRGGVFYPADAYLYPNVLMAQLRKKLAEMGVQFHPGRRVTAISTEGRKVEALRSEGGDLEADAFVLAAGSWTAQLLRPLGVRLPLQDGKGYSITFSRPARRPRHASILVEARVAVTPMGDDLRLAGTLELSGLVPGVNVRRVQAILDAFDRYFPKISLPQVDPACAWYGYRPCTPDGLPYIGFLKKFDNLVIATGHAMLGLSLAPATGAMVRKLFEGKADPVHMRFFDPNRYL